MSNHSKGIASLLIIIILALVITAGIVYYAYTNGRIGLIPFQKQLGFTPTPTAEIAQVQYPTTEPTIVPVDTTNWVKKTSGCGFTFKIPPDWTDRKYPYYVDELTPKQKSEYCAYIVSPEYTYGVDNQYGYTIMVKKIPSALTGGKSELNNLDDFINYYKSAWNIKGRTESGIFGLIPHITFGYPDKNVYGTKAIIAFNGSYFWDIEWSDDKELRDKMETIVESITFKGS